jgi:hypothetical protein
MRDNLLIAKEATMDRTARIIQLLNTNYRTPAEEAEYNLLTHLEREELELEDITTAAPCTIVDHAFKTPRRYDHVTGVVAPEDFDGFRSGDALRPAVLVMDAPGARTAYVAVDLATVTIEL